MSPPDPTPAGVSPDQVERWLGELGIVALARLERDGVTSWDLELDGRRRFGIRATLILDPAVALIAWVHYAPPIGDSFRRSYRQLLRWNDELPFAKFALAEDGRPILAAELPVGRVECDDLGLALARLLAICDRLLDASAGWIWYGGAIPDAGRRASRQEPLFERFGDRLTELLA